MTIDPPDNLNIDFSHRFEPKGHTDNEIDRLFHSMGFMVARAEGVLEMLFRATEDDARINAAVDAALCEVKDIGSAIAVLHPKVGGGIKGTN